MRADHPKPHVPNRSIPQRYACEEPENPRLPHVLWHASCPACLIHLQVAIAHNPGLVLLTHGATVADWRPVACGPRTDDAAGRRW